MALGTTVLSVRSVGTELIGSQSGLYERVGKMRKALTSEQKGRRIKMALEGAEIDIPEVEFRTELALAQGSPAEGDVIPVCFICGSNRTPKLFGYEDCPMPFASYHPTPKFRVDVYDAKELWEAVQRWIAAMD